MAQDDYADTHCEECSEELVEADGEWFCPACDSLSGFQLVPDEDEFAL